MSKRFNIISKRFNIVTLILLFMCMPTMAIHIENDTDTIIGNTQTTTSSTTNSKPIGSRINMASGDNLTFGLIPLSGLKPLTPIQERDSCDTIIAYTTERIESHKFEGCNLHSIIIPDGVSEIGDGAFLNCKNLQYIILPQSVEKIGTRAFCGCTNLRYVILDNGLKEIGDEAFAYCDNLQHILLPNSLTKIGANAFGYCKSLETICIPRNVKELGSRAFKGCKSLHLIVMPLIDGIDNELFQDCDSIQQIGFYATDSISHKVNFVIGTSNVQCYIYIPSSVKYITDETLKDIPTYSWNGAERWHTYTSLNKSKFNYAFDYSIRYKDDPHDKYAKKWYPDDKKKGMAQLNFLSEDKLRYILPFSLYYFPTIQQNVIDWAEDKEGERTADWAKRVTIDSINHVYQQYYKPLEQEYIKHRWENIKLVCHLNGYNYNERYFLCEADDLGTVKIYVPNNKAEYVDKNWEQGTFSATYCIRNDALCIETLTLTLPNGEQYTSK